MRDFYRSPEYFIYGVLKSLLNVKKNILKTDFNIQLINMDFTKQEIKWIKDHLKTIETIVKNASASHIDMEFREGILNIGKNHKLISCSHCNTEIYLGVTRIYTKYCNDILSKKNKS